MKHRKQKDKEAGQGAIAFDRHYTELFGLEKWPALKTELLRDASKVSLLSPFKKYDSKYTVENVGEIEVSPMLLDDCYTLDPASVVVADAVKAEAGSTVLDMCAAPGGKALSLLYKTRGEIQLTCNELSLPRFKRLRSVLRDHLPTEVYERINFKKGDASRLGLFLKESFDQVLLDAPCSGERHLLKSTSELNLWTEKRSKGLHQRQVALICSGFDCLRPGGHLVYSTCSINSNENDGVIEKLLKKRKTSRVQRLDLDIGEKTAHGRMILPIEKGWGPIYLSKIFKSEN